MPIWILFDDPASERLRPFTWVRPASELRLGMETLVERWTRLVHPDPVHVLTCNFFGSLEPGRITCEDLDVFHDDTIWVSDLVVPNEVLVDRLRKLPSGNGAGSPESALVRTGSPKGKLANLAEVQHWVLGARDPFALSESEVLSGLADLLRLHESLLPRDLDRWLSRARPGHGKGDGAAHAGPSRGWGDGAVYNESAIWIGPDCRIDHGAVLDAREGAIVLGPGTQVFPHTWIRGPFHAAGNSHLLGGRIGGGSAFGPQCRVRGEVEASVFLGYDNKAHDGFIGHSYLGEWVNLGALTTTSDLKNNYGTVQLEIRGERIDTKSKKVGSFLGDHVKTRIGTMLNTGAVVGLGANLFVVDAVFGKWIRDFSWGGGADSGLYALDRFLQTAEIVLGRRQVAWTPDIESMLRAAYAASTENPAP